jgi:hypothetical protein
MVFFDVPFKATVPPGWLVRETDGGNQHFHSRNDAIRFAMGSAHAFGLGALANIEGQDGVWRSFDHAGRGARWE